MVSYSEDDRESHHRYEWGGEDHGGDCSFLRLCLLCSLVSEVLLSGWQPPTMTFLLSNLPFTLKICTKSLGRHCMPSCSAIAGTCLSSWFCYPLDDIEEKLKSDMWNWFLTFEVPFQFRIRKLELPVILMSTELSELTGPLGYFWKWLKSLRGRCKSGYTDFVRKIVCVNVCAECNIRLI